MSKGCSKVKNPCKICLQAVTHKNGLKCQGACSKWAHFKCLGYTPGKISDIKKGLIKVLCPCPDCDATGPKEMLSNPPHSCSNTKCPANEPPKCGSPDCPSVTAAKPIPPATSNESSNKCPMLGSSPLPSGECPCSKPSCKCKKIGNKQSLSSSLVKRSSATNDNCCSNPNRSQSPPSRPGSGSPYQNNSKPSTPPRKCNSGVKCANKSPILTPPRIAKEKRMPLKTPYNYPPKSPPKPRLPLKSSSLSKMSSEEKACLPCPGLTFSDSGLSNRLDKKQPSIMAALQDMNNTVGLLSTQMKCLMKKIAKS